MDDGLAELLARYESLPETLRAGRLGAEEKDKLLTVLTAAIAEHRAQQEERDRVNPAAIGLAVLEPAQWPEVLTSMEAARQAEQHLRGYFARTFEARGQPWFEGIFQSFVNLLRLAASSEDAATNPFLQAAARNLVAEMMVAKSATEGVKPKALQALRSSISEAALPSNITKAFEQARLMEKLAPGEFRHQAGKKQPPKKHNNNKAN